MTMARRIAHRYYYRVVRAGKALTTKVFDTIKAFLKNGRTIPTDEIDKALPGLAWPSA